MQVLGNTAFYFCACFFISLSLCQSLFQRCLRNMMFSGELKGQNIQKTQEATGAAAAKDFISLRPLDE